MLHKRWIMITLLTTILWAENNVSDTSINKDNNISSDTNISNTINNTSSKIANDNITRRDSNISQIISTLIPKMNDINHFNGAWHLRVIDGMDTRKARAILDFNMEQMKLSGFDACNRIGGTMVKHSEYNTTVPILRTTRMACRQNIHSWVSKRLHTALKEGFLIKKDTKYGIEGLTLKSPSHELFFKKMGRD